MTQYVETFDELIKQEYDYVKFIRGGDELVCDAYEERQFKLQQIEVMKRAVEKAKENSVKLAEYQKALATYQRDFANYTQEVKNLKARYASQLQSYQASLEVYKANRASYDIEKAAYDAAKQQYDSDLAAYQTAYAEYRKKLDEYNNWQGGNNSNGWLEAWGTYAKTGPYNNVTMGGSPNGTLYGLNLTSAKNAGFGNGVKFNSLNDAGTSVNIELSLVGYGSNASGQAILNQKYVQGNWTYDWYVDVYYSTDNQASWATAEQNILVAKHASTQRLAYGANWHLSTIKWNKTFNLPSNFTHLKFEVRGDEPAQRHQNIFTRQQVIRPTKPVEPTRPTEPTVFNELPPSIPTAPIEPHYPTEPTAPQKVVVEPAIIVYHEPYLKCNVCYDGGSPVATPYESAELAEIMKNPLVVASKDCQWVYYDENFDPTVVVNQIKAALTLLNQQGGTSGKLMIPLIMTTYCKCCVDCTCQEFEAGWDMCDKLHEEADVFKNMRAGVAVTPRCDIPTMSWQVLFRLHCMIGKIITAVCWLTDKLSQMWDNAECLQNRIKALEAYYKVIHSDCDTKLKEDMAEPITSVVGVSVSTNISTTGGSRDG